MVRVGVIGFGFMGRMHCRALVAVDKEALYAIADVSEDALRRAKKEYPWVKTYDSAEKLIHDPEVDAVIIASYPNTHVEYLIEAIKNNKHVLVEKPLATRFSEVKPLLKIEYDGLTVMTGFSLRYHPMYRDVYGILRRHGRTIIAHHTALGSFPNIGWLLNTELSGGMVNENAVHILYLFYWYLGDVDSVYARLYSIKRPGLDDNAVITLIHEEGSLSSLVRSWTSGQVIRYFEFITEKGSVHIEGYLEGVVREAFEEYKKVQEKRYPRIFEEMYVEEIKEFLSSIRERREPSTSLWDGIRVQAIVEAIRLSNREGRIVRVTEVVNRDLL